MSGSKADGVREIENVSAIRPVIVKALETPEYKWRTIRGVATVTNIPEKEVLLVIKMLGDEGKVIQSSLLNQDSEVLYTTRKHYREKTSIIGRMMSAILPIA